MNRRIRLLLRLLAIGVIAVGAVILLPRLLGGLEVVLREIRHNWWLLVGIGLSIWVLFALGKKR